MAKTRDDLDAIENFFEVMEEKKYRTLYYQSLDKCESLLVAVHRSQFFGFYASFEKELALIKAQYTLLHQLSHFYKIRKLKKLINQLETLKKNIQETLAPKCIKTNHFLYPQTINRICFRGDNRAPFGVNNSGIFHTGFSKALDQQSREYQESRKVGISEDLTEKISYPLASNPATTISVTRDLKVAALFPMSGDLAWPNLGKIFALMESLIKSLMGDSFEIDLRYEYILAGFAKDSHTPMALLEEKYSRSHISNICHIFYKKKLPHHIIDQVALEAAAKIRDTILKDESWIYVVWVDKGFDVLSHGCIYTLFNGFANKPENYFFAQEICVDFIPPQHVVAAFRVQRDLSKIYFSEESIDYSRAHGEGGASIKEIVYNPLSLTFLQENKVDVKHYQILLESFMQENRHFKIPLSEQGFLKKSLS